MGTWTAISSYHAPIFAYGQTALTTGTIGLGASTFAVTNTGTTIDVGDHVFVSTSANANNQYVGRCLVSSAASITVERVTQNNLGAGAKVWKPTASVFFELNFSIGGQTQVDNDGTRLIVTRGGGAYPFQDADSTRRIQAVFNPAYPEDVKNWRTFRQTGRTYGTDAFSIGYWDEVEETSKVQRVYTEGSEHAVTRVDGVIASFSVDLFVVSDDTYVTS